MQYLALHLVGLSSFKTTSKYMKFCLQMNKKGRLVASYILYFPCYFRRNFSLSNLKTAQSRSSVQVNSKHWFSVSGSWWYIILRSWEAPSHLMWQNIQIWRKVRTSHHSMLHAQTTSECKQDPLVEKMTTVSRIPPVVLTARFAASSPTTRTLASWWSTTTSLAGNSGQEVWLSPPLCL